MNYSNMNLARATVQRPQRPQYIRRMRLFPLLLLLLILLIVLSSLLLVAPSLASAAAITGGPLPHASSNVNLAQTQMPAGSPSCSGQGCNFTNPYTTDCAGQSWDSWWVVLSGYLRDSHGNVGGYVQLWWSATCQTNWTRVVSYHTPYELEALIRLQNGYGNNANATISEQFYAPTTLACSYGAIWLGGGSPTYSGEVSQYQGGC
jgi:hypothetical protein